MRLLVVDDNPKNAKLLKAILTPYGECESVECGKAAILAFEKAWNDWCPFRFIFLDIMMPETDGEKVSANIRDLYQLKTINLPDLKLLPHFPHNKYVRLQNMTSLHMHV
jgi:CheY-like chemotaxis protein